MAAVLTSATCIIVSPGPRMSTESGPGVTTVGRVFMSLVDFESYHGLRTRGKDPPSVDDVLGAEGCLEGRGEGMREGEMY